MSDEIFFNGRRYVSAHDAAFSAGLTRDYVARLCRDGKVIGRQVGKHWYVEDASLKTFLVTQEYAKSRRNESLTRERTREYHEAAVAEPVKKSIPVRTPPISAQTSILSPIDRSAFVPAVAHVSGVLASRADEIKNKMAAAVLGQSRGTIGHAKHFFNTPGGLAHAALSAAHVPVYTVTPVAEFFHKVVALSLALMLTIGTYAAVDPAYARFAADSVRDSVDAALDSYHAETGGGLGALTARTQAQVAAAAENPGGTVAWLASSVPDVTATLARAFNTKVNGFFYAIAFPGSLTERSVLAVQIVPYHPNTTPNKNPPPVPTTASTIAPRTGPINQTIINNPVVERTVETTRLVSAGGISEELLNQKIADLDNKLSSRILASSAANTTQITNVYQAAASVGRIEHLDGLDLTNPTITGGSIAGTGISGAASLSVSGSTSLSTTTATNLSVTDTTSTSTFAGNLSVDGDFNFNGALLQGGVAFSSSQWTTAGSNIYYTGNVGIGTTSPYAMLSVAGEVAGRNFTATSTTNVNNFPLLLATNATSTNLFATTASSTDLFASSAQFGNMVLLGSSTLQNFTGVNATTTNFFATTASSTNLFAQTATFGSLSFLNALGVSSGGTGATTFGQGWIYSSGGTNALAASTSPTVNYVVATSTIIASQLPYASSTALTVSGTGYFGLGQFTNTSGTTTLASGQGFTIGSTQFTLQQGSGAVGIGTNAPISAALLQLDSTSKAFLPPRMTTAQKNAIGSPTGGLVLYDSDLNKLNVYNGSAWKNVGSTEVGGEVTSGTAGSVLFIGDGTVLGQDNANFNYSTSTNRLLLTQASSTRLSVFGTAYFGGSATTTIDSSGNLLVAGSTTLQNFTFANATGTSATTTNFFATTASSTNLFAQTAALGSLSLGSALPATSGGTGASTVTTGDILYGSGTNAWSKLAIGTVGTTGILGISAGVPAWVATSTLGLVTLTGTETLTNKTLTSPTVTGGTFTGTATFANASTTNFSALTKASFGSTATSTFDSEGNLLVAGSTTLQNFTFANATGTSATTTNFFATTASSTNLFAQTAALGSLTSNALTLGTFTGPLQALSGVVSASSTLSVTYGGTGASTFAINGILFGNTAGAIQATAAAANSILATNGSNVPALTQTIPTAVQDNITRLGTIVSGVWTGTTIAVANGGTGQTSFGQGWLASNGTTLSASTSPTVNYLVATSTTIASIFPYASTTALTVSGTGYFGTASTTNLIISSAVSGVLKTDASGVVSAGRVTLSDTTQVSGTLAVTNGGTGWANFTSGTVLLGNGSGALSTTTRGNLTETGSSILTITGGTNALLGSGATIEVAQSSGSVSGFLSSTDWTTFNTKLASSSISTSAMLAALLSDETGTGSVVFSASPTFTGTANFANLNFGAAATTTIVNNNAYAWVIATSSTGSPLFRIDTTSGSEQINIGYGGTDVTIGDVGLGANLVFEENSTIKGQSSGRTLTFGAGSDIINFGVRGNFTAAASSTQLSVFGKSYFGGSATTTIDSSGNLLVAGSTTLQNFTFANATGTSATTTNFFATTASSTNLFAQTASFGTLSFLNTLGVSSGGTGASSFGQGWIYSAGGTGALAASTSPTVNYLVATSTTFASTFPYASTTALTISGNSYLGTVSSGTWNGTAIGALYGGTNQTSWTKGDLLYSDNTNTLAKLAIGTIGSTGILGISAGVPAWVATSTLGLVTLTGTETLTNKTLTSPTISAPTITGLATLANASTSLLSVTSKAWFGGTATSTFDSAGRLGVGTSTAYSPLSVWGANTTSGVRAVEVTDSASTTLFYIDNAGLTWLKSLFATASSTIGGGTQSTGLTISGGATTTGYLVVQGTAATSTFAAGISATYLNLTGASTATSTASNGLNLTGGCFSVSGTCVGGSGSGVTGGTAGMLAAFTSATALTATSGPTFAFFTATSTTATSTLAFGLQATALNLTSTTASSTAANGINLSGGCFAVGGTCLPSSVAGDAPVGTVIAYAGATLPSGYLSADGSAVSRTTYSDLFTAIGTTWGVGDGSTTFNVPDLRGRNVIGSGTGSGLTNRVLGATSSVTAKTGEESHTMTTSELVAHTHVINRDAAVRGDQLGNSTVPGTNAPSGTMTTDSTGGGTAFNVMDPFAVTQYAVKAANSVSQGTINGATVLNTLSYFSASTTLNSASFLNVDVTNSRFGIGTSTPWAKLSVNNYSSGASTAPLFIVASSTGTSATSTALIVDSLGNVGIGTTTPWANLSLTSASQQSGLTSLFSVASTTGAQLLNIFGNGNIGIGATSTPGSIFSVNNVLNLTAATSTFYSTGGVNLAAGCFSIAGTCVGGSATAAGSEGNIQLYSGGLLAASSTFTFSTAGNLGIGTSTPWAKLSVAGAAGATAPLFSISSSTAAFATTTVFHIDQNGLVGIGTTTPTARVAIQGADTSATTKSFQLTDSTGADMLRVFNNGLTILKNLIATASSTIGDGTQAGGLTVSGGATTSQALVVQGTSASSTFAGNVEVAGALKIGTGSIYLNGAATSTFSAGIQTSALNITSTTATSTFANGLNLAAGCLTYNGSACIGQNGSVTLTQVIASSSVGSNTSFTVPTNTAYIVVEVWGAGGGGGRSGAAGSGSSGGTSCFGTSNAQTDCTQTVSLKATGGGGGTGYSGTASKGGTGGVGSSGDVNLTGQGGGGGDSNAESNSGGIGGSAPRGGGGGLGSGVNTDVGTVGGAFGGGGSGGGGGTSYATGGGGGGGGYSQKTITAPSGTYYYTVGAGGAGGTGGGNAGGAGGAGGVTIYVYTTATLTSSGSGVTLTNVVTKTSGSGTYSPPSNISYIEVEMVGAGGGGAGSGTAGAPGGNGGTGGDTTFGSSLLTASGGTGASAVGGGSSGAGGGSGTIEAGATGHTVIGGSGGPTAGYQATALGNFGGGSGGNSYFGCGGAGGLTGPGAGATNSGGGGGGAGIGNVSGSQAGAGGGAGGYVKAFITSPSGSYEYSVGAAGSGGSAGTSGSAGAAGAAGKIVIYEYTTGAATAGSVGSGTAGQFAFYNAAGSNLTATSTLFMNTTTGFMGIGSTTPGQALDVNGNINIAAGKCYMVNNVCIGYVKRLAGIYATSTPGSNVAVTLSTAGLAFASGALTIPATTTEIVVETWGGGGGGGGQTNVGGGGGGAGYSQEVFTSPSGTYYYTVGAGGAGGTGAGNGSTGGSTCFGTNATACTSPSLSAAGGSGGNGDNAGGGYGGAGGSGSGGNVNLTGQDGNWAHFAMGAGGEGGSAPRGGGGIRYGAGRAFGGGGGGGQDGGGGGAGGAGGIVITVYATSSPTAAGNDYAEMFPVSDPSINAGDIVAVDVGEPVSMKLAQKGDGSPLAGVIATAPGQLLGDINARGERPVALMGRVPVKVSLENGAIKIGDRIAVSSVPGVGKKAGVFDPSVGIAIDTYDGTQAGGTVMVFLDLQSPPTLQMVGEGLLNSTSQNDGFDFISGLFSAIQSRIAAAQSPITGNIDLVGRYSGLTAVQNFNTIYNPAPPTSELSSQVATSSYATLTASTTSALLDYLSIVPSLAKGIGELDARTSFISNAFGTSTALWVDSSGNIGIGMYAQEGTSTLTHQLSVAGEIGADAFVVRSPISETRTALTEGDEDTILGQIGSVPLFSPQDASSSVQYLGFGEGAPSSILSPSGDVDIYKLGAFMFAGLKSLDRKVNGIASTTASFGLRIDSLETILANMKASTSTPHIDLRGRYDMATTWVRPAMAWASDIVTSTTTPSEAFASTTPWVASFADSSQSLRDGISALGDTIVSAFNSAIYAATGIFDKVFSKEVHTDKLCVSGEGGETCITKAQLDALLIGQTATAAGASDAVSGGGTSDGGSSPARTPAPASEPSLESTPEPTSEQTSEPTPETPPAETPPVETLTETSTPTVEPEPTPEPTPETAPESTPESAPTPEPAPVAAAEEAPSDPVTP